MFDIKWCYRIKEGFLLSSIPHKYPSGQSLRISRSFSLQLLVIIQLECDHFHRDIISVNVRSILCRSIFLLHSIKGIDSAEPLVLGTLALCRRAKAWEFSTARLFRTMSSFLDFDISLLKDFLGRSATELWWSSTMPAGISKASEFHFKTWKLLSNLKVWPDLQRL
jgi:hypothetical protein